MLLFYYIIKRVLIAVFFLSAVIIASGADQVKAQTAEDTFIVMGTGIIKKEDVSAARQGAIKNSLVTAVGLKAADLANLDSMVRNFEALNGILRGRIDKLIRDYKVLAETRSDGIYRVMVQVTVSSGRIKNKLAAAGIMQAKKAMPRILFFVAEQSLEDGSPRYWWGKGMPFIKTASEKAIAEVMKEKGFKIMDHGPRVQNMAIRVIDDKPDVSDRSAIDFAAKLNAEIIVIGKSIANNLANTMGADMKSFRGLITVRAFRVKTGKQIAIASKTAVTANVDEFAGARDALSGAGTLIGEDLSRQIASVWHKKDKQAENFEILLKGAGNLANFVMFRRMLSNIPGVEFVQVKELKSDKARISVDFHGKARELADALMLKAFESFGINIYDVSDNQLKIELIPGRS